MDLITSNLLSYNDIALPSLELPLAIIIHRDGLFDYVNHTDCYLKELQSIGFSSLESALDFFNNKDSGVYDSFYNSVLMSLDSGTTVTKEFVAKETYCTIKIRGFYSEKSKDIIVIRAFLLNVSKYNHENNNLDTALRSLYSLYDTITLINLDNSDLRYIYTNLPVKSESIIGSDYTSIINNYAQNYVYSSEQDKFIKYFDEAQIKKLFHKAKRRFHITYYRIKNLYDEYVWKAFLLMQVVDKSSSLFYLCIRDVDLTKEHALLEENYIDLFFDMPMAYSIFKVFSINNRVTDIICLFASSKITQLMHVPIEHVIGHSIIDSLSNKKQWLDIIARVALGGESITETLYIEKTGKWVRLLLNQAAERGKFTLMMEDVTEEQASSIQKDRKWRTDDLIIDCVKTLDNGKPFEENINNLLELLGKKLNAKRIYIIEPDNEKGSSFSVTYAWARDPNDMLKENFKRLKPDEIINWSSEFDGIDNVVIYDAEDCKESHPYVYNNLKHYEINSIVEIPILKENKRLGAIGAVDLQKDDMLDVEHLFETISFFIASEITRKNLMTKLENISIYDSLCNVKNRNAMELTISRIKEVSIPVGVIYADANGLKTINDTQGHEAGDRTIKELALILSDCFGKDRTYRSGGDEFVAICEDISFDDFQQKVLEFSAMLADKTDISVAAGWQYSEDSKEIINIMKKADQKMYDAKAEHYKKIGRRKTDR